MDLQLNILCEGEDNIGTVSRVEDVKLVNQTFPVKPKFTTSCTLITSIMLMIPKSVNFNFLCTPQNPRFNSCHKGVLITFLTKLALCPVFKELVIWLLSRKHILAVLLPKQSYLFLSRTLSLPSTALITLLLTTVTTGVGDGQGGLACCDSWGRKELDTTERLI